ncbi:hypothetical protein EPI10_023517 [Gossypium australe]|uniref:Reverse transcriptase n=1 Tax=Gossypium australe TaxID=47621 RepID=A0A5B6VUG4_9ROSI|nr:hypothetical protein EPI10_023517 [Gossypium australe]
MYFGLRETFGVTNHGREEKERIISDFEGSLSRRGIHWCKWSNICKLKENGSLSFRVLVRYLPLSYLEKYLGVKDFVGIEAPLEGRIRGKISLFGWTIDFRDRLIAKYDI